MTLHQTFWIAGWTLALTASAPFAHRAASPVPLTQSATTSDISVVGPDAIQFRADNEDQAQAFNAALELAYANRTDMGYPWIDLATNTLELAAVNDAGRKAAQAATLDLDQAGLTSDITKAQASIAKLDDLADQVTRLLDEGVPDADLIWMTEPDQKNNRVIITIRKSSDALLKNLASRFATDLIAVRIREGGPAILANRDSDAPSFWGGAYITTSTGKACTTGFAWTAGGQASMLTAAHCISTGGRVSYPSFSNVGGTTANSEENWSDANGTQHYTGQGVDRGDVALIRYDSLNSTAYVYSGAVHTSTSSKVAGMFSRWAQFGDDACDNGVVTGEWCGMVIQTGVDKWYLVNGINVWARHMDVAEAIGPTCPQHGDSGSPVYHKRSDGRIDAKGIFSGFLPVGVACDIYFTDIWDSYYGLPGVIKTTT